MTTLANALGELYERMAGGAGQPPLPDEVVIADVDPRGFDPKGRPVIAAVDLRTPSQYEARFVALLASGHQWLNLSYCGLLDGKGLVLVEVPRQTPVSPGGRVPSINFSAPPAFVSAPTWDAREGVVVG